MRHSLSRNTISVTYWSISLPSHSKQTWRFNLKFNYRYQRLNQSKIQYFKLWWKTLVVLSLYNTQQLTQPWKTTHKINSSLQLLLAWPGTVQPSASSMTAPISFQWLRIQRNYNTFITIKQVSNTKNVYLVKHNIVQSFNYFKTIYLLLCYMKHWFFRPRWYHTKLGKGYRLLCKWNSNSHISNLVHRQPVIKLLFYL